MPNFNISSIAFHCNAHADAGAHEICQLIPGLRLRRRRRSRWCVKLILQLLRRVLGVSQPVFNTAQSFILSSAFADKCVKSLRALNIGNKLLHKCRRAHSVVGNDSIIRQNILCINSQASLFTAYVAINVDICLAVIIGYVDSGSDYGLFTRAYLCLGNHTVHRFRFNINVLLQLSHLRSLTNGNTALVVTRSDIQSYITQIGIFRNIHSSGLSFTVHLAVGQGSNRRAAFFRFKGAVYIYCCLIMCFAVGYGSAGIILVPATFITFSKAVLAPAPASTLLFALIFSAGFTTLFSLLRVSVPLALITAF